MSMEVEFIAEFTEDTSEARARKIIKGRRTKRQRAFPTDRLTNKFTPDQSPIRSSDLSSEEDEDMANCLIMLAQSESPVKESESESDPIHHKTEKLSSTRFTEMIKTDYYIYECKTCNRAFPSFQALGGHRASHKKPKLNVEDKKSSSVSVQYCDEQNDQDKTVVIEDKENTLRMFVNNNIVKSSSPKLLGLVQTGLTNNKIKVHECSICGSEFSSGQALGGHMRKHRPVAPSVNRLTESVTEKSPGGGTSCTLSLDLNFPPPEVIDDVVQSKFKFTAGSSQQQHLVFSAPAFVDCHY